MRHFIPIILTVSTITLAQSRSFPAPGEADDAPKSSTVAAAKAKYDASIKTAHDAFVKLVLDADQNYIDTLTKAEDATMKQGIAGKPDADAIDAARLAGIETMKQHRNDTADRPAAQQDMASKTFWYGYTNSGGSGLRKMSFAPDGSITAGAAGLEQRWAVSDGTLNIFDADRNVTMKLARCADGAWAGRWLVAEKGEVFLFPLDGTDPSQKSRIDAVESEPAEGRVDPAQESRRILESRLAGTKWHEPKPGVIWTLNKDGTCIISDGRTAKWAAINSTTILLVVNDGWVDEWQFDGDLKTIHDLHAELADPWVAPRAD
ncbi:MAG: hypothetical protein ABSB42_21845 [Tepidisphaeraceae bacterium]|jgi:hypothetical protein